MRSDMRQIASKLIWVKLGFCLLLPFFAYAAEQKILRSHAIEDVTFWTWLFLWLFSTAGWAMVHLDTLVEWFRPPENVQLTWEQSKVLWKSRLKIVMNYIASLTAGVAFYLLASAVPHWVGLAFELPQFVLLVGAVPAAMGGTATWDKIGSRFMGPKAPHPSEGT